LREGDSWFDRQVSPYFLLFTGLLLAPAIILQQNLIIKAIQSVLFLCLAVGSLSAGKRRLVVGSLIFVLTTVIVNLFSPVGRVIVRIGPLPITLGALRVGISKATTVVSLLCISRLCVRSSVRLPGVLGRYLSETFRYLNRLLAQRGRVTGKKVVQRLDELFEHIVDDHVEEKQGSIYRAGNTTLGVLVLLALLVLNWAAVFLPISALLAEFWPPIL
jgi:hypothetical protein